MTILAPCRASSRTIAWPIPLFPPVTMATLSCNDMTSLSAVVYPPHCGEKSVDPEITAAANPNDIRVNTYFARCVYQARAPYTCSGARIGGYRAGVACEASACPVPWTLRGERSDPTVGVR